jgi:hypothetical protein
VDQKEALGCLFEPRSSVRYGPATSLYKACTFVGGFLVLQISCLFKSNSSFNTELLLTDIRVIFKCGAPFCTRGGVEHGDVRTTTMHMSQ